MVRQRVSLRDTRFPLGSRGGWLRLGAHAGLLGVLSLVVVAARAQAAQPPVAEGTVDPLSPRDRSHRGPQEREGAGFSFASIAGFGYVRGLSSHWLGGFVETRFGAAWSDYRVKLWVGPRIYGGQSLPGLPFIQPALILGMGYQVAPHLQLGLDLGLVSPWFLQRATTRQYQLFWYTAEISTQLLVFFHQDRRLSGPALSIRPGLDLNFGGRTTPKAEAGFRLLVGVSYVY